MHSTQFTRLAQAADYNGWTILAMCEIPPSPGSYPSAWCVCERDLFAGDAERPTNYVVTMGVIREDNEDDREDAFFTWSTYDLNRVQAQQIFEQKNAEEIRKAA
jgi:hypothetical protein